MVKYSDSNIIETIILQSMSRGSEGIIKTANYARERLSEHIKCFHYLIHSIENDSLNQKELNLIEELNQAFKEISFKSYALPA